MRVELFPFQKSAVRQLRDNARLAIKNYKATNIPQVISFTAPTGAGKTIVMASLVEDIFYGYEDQVEYPNSIFVWLSDSPQLNEQSKQKFDLQSDKIKLGQCITIEDESFDRETLEDGHIYFLNTQKIGKAGNLTKHSDTRQYTIWETLENTINEKSDRLYFIIDEAHRGMQGREAGKATSIMQKFVKGSPSDKLSPMPVVIGMSATPERFNKLIDGMTTSTLYKVVVTADEVRASGLLKDRIIITYPEDHEANNDFAILQAATDEWISKCEHWYQYTYEQHYKNVNPVFVIQVENGDGGRLSNTDLDACLAKIEERTQRTFKQNEVVHTFGSTGDISINGLNVRHVEASEITDDRRIRVVFFKENLSTGWDCPRAETMMSFRSAIDATYIAQLLGRMIRTPLQMHIQVDDSLNDVHLYLPYFERDTVNDVIKGLQEEEGGDIPTYLDQESYENPVYKTYTSNPRRSGTPGNPNQISIFDIQWGETQEESSVEELKTELFGGEDAQRENYENTRTLVPQQEPTVEPQKSTPVIVTPPIVEKPTVKQLSIPGFKIDRADIVKHINNLGLLTYDVKNVRINSYLVSVFKLARLLSQNGIDSRALGQIKSEIVEMIHDYAEGLRKSGEYDRLAEAVTQLKLSSQIFDVFGEKVENYKNLDIFTSSDEDIDRQLNMASKKLGDFGVVSEYGCYYDEDNPNEFKIDIILFAADADCMAKLQKYAKDKFHELDDNNRRYIISRSEKDKKAYDDIVADGDLVSKHLFRIPELISVKQEEGGTDYDNHLFIDEDTGFATLKLNGWEKGVIEEETKADDFVCWLRNPSRGSWALRIPYEVDKETKPTYPDFLVIRSDPHTDYVIDILEPHNPEFKDNYGKARAFAFYAKDNPQIGRVELIREGKDPAGRTRYKRLDLAKGAIADAVLAAKDITELDQIFNKYGEFRK